MNVYIGWPTSQQVTNYVPQMTANTQDWYTATSSTQLSDVQPWMAFYVSTQWGSPTYGFHSNAIWSWNRWWSQIQLPKWIIVNKIEIWARRNESSTNLRPIGAFSLKWSNDWSTWTEIKAVSWLWSSWSIWSVQSWNITGQTTAYTYLKLEVQAYSTYVAFDYWNIDWVVEEVKVLKNAYIGEYKGRLPAGYQEVEWIWSSRTQVINTWVIPITQTYTAELEFESTQSWTEYWAFGIWGSTWFRAWQDSSWHWDTSFWASYSPATYALNTKTIATVSNSWLWTSSNTALWLFGMGENGAYPNNRKWAYKIYYCKIWNSWTLIRDFVPCYRISDSVIWMYDLVNDVFYTNAGTWTFTKWPDVN